MFAYAASGRAIDTGMEPLCARSDPTSSHRGFRRDHSRCGEGGQRARIVSQGRRRRGGAAYALAQIFPLAPRAQMKVQQSEPSTQGAPILKQAPHSVRPLISSQRPLQHWCVVRHRSPSGWQPFRLRPSTPRAQESWAWAVRTAPPIVRPSAPPARPRTSERRLAPPLATAFATTSNRVPSMSPHLSRDCQRPISHRDQCQFTLT